MWWTAHSFSSGWDISSSPLPPRNLKVKLIPVKQAAGSVRLLLATAAAAAAAAIVSREKPFRVLLLLSLLFPASSSIDEGRRKGRETHKSQKCRIKWGTNGFFVSLLINSQDLLLQKFFLSFLMSVFNVFFCFGKICVSFRCQKETWKRSEKFNELPKSFRSFVFLSRDSTNDKSVLRLL